MITETYQNLNAQLNLPVDGAINVKADKDAARAYFLQEINPHTRFFHNLREKTDYMLESEYWSSETVDMYPYPQFKALFKQAYAHKFRFETLLGALKFYQGYALKETNRDIDGNRTTTYLERFEDRVVMTAVHLSQGDYAQAEKLVDAIITGRFQPATPTFLNAGRAKGGEMVSCFLLRVEDDMESIGRVVNSSLQLSKRGGGVGILLTNLRERGAPIKGIPDTSSGVVPVMKILEDAFSYANQLGQRQGAGAVYINAHHPDIMSVLDTKRENADEKVRIKTLSLGIVVPDVTFHLAKNNDFMYLFSPYDVERVEGKPFADCSVTGNYEKWVEDDRITKTKVKARDFFRTLSELQFESGYPYVLFEDTANKFHTMGHVGKINMSNLCVAPETKVLTDEGYKEIEKLAGSHANVWNGEKFSRSFVDKTGEDRRLITIDFDNGASLDVTEYHKFYVKSGYGNRKVVEVRAGELKPGDMLEKFDFPVVDSPDAPDFPHAYTAGLHTAEGTYGRRGDALLRLYPGKTHLGQFIDYQSSSLTPDSTGRVSYVLPPSVPRKYEVPLGYSLESRLAWLAGLIDGDGWGNGKSGMQIGSIHPEFLEQVRLLLSTLGVDSRWSKVRDEGHTQFKPGQKAYPTQAMYRLVVCGFEAQKLRRLGLPTHRVEIEEYEHQRAARAYIRVESIINEGRVDDTYCLNEPELHKAVFNGIRTGQCSEISQLNTPSVLDASLGYEQVGADISCNLGSLNVKKMLDLSQAEFVDTVRTAVRALNAVSAMTDIESVPSVLEGNRKSRAIGLGQMNLHGALAHHGLRYGSPEALQLWDNYMALVTWAAMTESAELAKDFGETPYFDGSEYDTGEWWDRVPKAHLGRTDDLTILGSLRAPDKDDWNDLHIKVSQHGMANAYLQTIPPTGSISYINNSTSSIHPIVNRVETRKEGKIGRVYYPAPHMRSDNLHLYESAYELGYEKLIDTYAVSQFWVDQSQSLTTFFPSTATTRDLDKARIYAWRKGVKSMYYVRLRQEAMDGTAVDGTGVQECESCLL